MQNCTGKIALELIDRIIHYITMQQEHVMVKLVTKFVDEKQLCIYKQLNGD